MSRFVQPETTTLKISLGDTLTVKRRLSAGEQRAAFARMYVAGADGDLKVAPLQVGIATILAYLVDWSLTDDDGKLVEIRGQSSEYVMAALDALDPESFQEIRSAIERHDAAVTEEREAEKKSRAGETGSAAILPSADL